MLERREFLKRMLSATVACTALSAMTERAWAKDGDGHGEGHDDGGHDDGGESRGGSRPLDQDEVLLERRKGRIIPLRRALGIVDATVPGKVIDVKLTAGFKGSLYRIKVRRDNGEITTIRLDAKTGKFVGPLGF
jgi:uncharacterized membrane protein YkoI